MDPTHPYSTRLGDQPADPAGRRWRVAAFQDAVNRAVDLRVELLARALFAAGGVAVPADDLNLAGSILTVTGPVIGITEDGTTPCIVDAPGAGVDLDLDTDGSGYGDGTHAVVVRAEAVTVPVPFATPVVPDRDPQGNIVDSIPRNNVTYNVVQTLGVLHVIDGTTPGDDEFVIATVDKTGSAWSAPTPAGSLPTLRS